MKAESEFDKQRHAEIGDLFYYEGRFNLGFMHGMWRPATVEEIKNGYLKTTNFYWTKD